MPQREQWLPVEEKGRLCQNLVVVGKVEANQIQKTFTCEITPDVQWSDERKSCTLGSACCRQMSDFARDCPSRGSRDENHSHLKRALGSFVGMVHDQSTTPITKPGTPCGSECGWRELISLVFSGHDGLVSIVTVFAPAGILVVVQILSTIVN